MTIHLNRNFSIFLLSQTGNLKTYLNSPSQTEALIFTPRCMTTPTIARNSNL
jgi:hypothetical protein